MKRSVRVFRLAQTSPRRMLGWAGPMKPRARGRRMDFTAYVESTFEDE